MHRVYRLFCKQSERISLVTSRSVLLKGASERTAQGGILWRSAFILAHKNGVVIIGTFVNRAVCNALLYELIINATPEKTLHYSVAIPVLRRQ